MPNTRALAAFRRALEPRKVQSSVVHVAENAAGKHARTTAWPAWALSVTGLRS